MLVGLETAGATLGHGAKRQRSDLGNMEESATSPKQMLTGNAAQCLATLGRVELP